MASTVKTEELKKNYNLNDICDYNDFDEYLNFIHQLLDKILDNYSLKNKSITFNYDDKTYKCSIANFTTQLVLLIPFVKFGYKFDSKFIILEKIKEFNSGLIPKYFNQIIDEYREYLTELNNEYGITIEELNLSFKDALNILSDLSGDCNVLSGTTLNLHDLFKLYKNNSRFKELVNMEVPSGLEFLEIEKFIKDEFSQLMDILRNEDTCFKPYFKAKTGINEKQFKEIISNIGLKADLDGNIIPYVIQNNFLKGLNTVTEFYINSILARKALITSHKRVKDSGWW